MQSNTPGGRTTGSPAAVRREPWESPWVWGFFVLVGVAVLCRQYFGAISYWYDEAFYLFNLYRRPFPALLGAVDCRVAAPPLYFGWSGPFISSSARPSLAMRLPSFLAGLTALFVMAPLARRLVGSPGWPWALAFCAFRPISSCIPVKCIPTPSTCWDAKPSSWPPAPTWRPDAALGRGPSRPRGCSWPR